MDFEKYIKETSEKIDFHSSSLVNIGKGILLSNHEIAILNQYQIPFRNCNDLKDILCYIENLLEENSDNEELIEISLSISERDYYMNTNK